MPIKSKRINLTFPPFRLRHLTDFGRANRMNSRDGSLKPASIAMDIICFVFDVFKDKEVQRYLDNNGGTFLDLVLRAVKTYINDGR